MLSRSLVLPGRGMVSRTSTLLLGVMKPATPATSLTETVTARCPSGTMYVMMPPEELSGMSLFSVMTSPALKGRTTIRPTKGL
ncbi:MAG: hypothetical protein ACD_55C00150G0002 [uncultured bacterium]|nr:MAG: hypothetical protein ACD_55C00150G0002 [uncultured bacterium]